MGCRHLIRSAESLATGYGAGCRAKMRKAQRTADLSAWTPSQVEDARQAIEDVAVVPSNRAGVFHVVSSDGTEAYRTSRDGCTCQNGLKTHQTRPCWHRLAVVLVTGTSAPSLVTPTTRTPIALPAAPAPGSDSDLWASLDRITDAFMAMA